MKPELKRVTYEAAISRTWDILESSDYHEISRRSKVPFDHEKGEFKLNFLGEEYFVSTSKKTVKTQNDQDVHSFLVVLLLHYLAYAKDMELTGKLITFRELEGGAVYYSAFCRRAINKITDAFGHEPEKLRQVGEKVGARSGDLGDVSIVLDAFPRVPITVIIWGGDSEVPSSSNMLFDSTIKEQLPTEDVAVSGGFVASYLIKNK